MNEIEILNNCADRLRSLETPTTVQNIVIIPTPYLINGTEVLLGKRHQGHLIALFPNKKSAHVIEGGTQKLSNGFQLSMQNLQDPNSKEILPFIELSNVSNIDCVLFGAFLDELLKSIDDEKSDLIQEIMTLLEKWKSMLSLDTEKVMSLNSLIGLFGELLFLEYLLSIEKTDILESWVGPNGNRHDFEFINQSIEVKSTTVKNGNEIHVSGVTQLEPYNGKSVNILRVKLEIEPNGMSLPTLVRGIMSSQLIDKVKFTEKLSKVGFRIEKESLYENIHFQPVEFQIIPVDSKFPRITANSLLNIDPTARIKDVEYVVNVSGLETQRQSKISSISFEGLL